MNLIFLQAETQTLGFSACALAVSITTTINKMLAYDFYTVLHVLTRAYTYRRGTYLCRCRVKVNTYKATRLSSTYSQMQSKYIFACKYIQSRPHIWAAELFPTRRIFTLPSNNWSTHTHTPTAAGPHHIQPIFVCEHWVTVVWAQGERRRRQKILPGHFADSLLLPHHRLRPNLSSSWTRSPALPLIPVRAKNHPQPTLTPGCDVRPALSPPRVAAGLTRARLPPH